MIYKLIGWYLKRQRIKRGLTLREFCIHRRHDASTISRLERGYYFEIAPEYKVCGGAPLSSMVDTKKEDLAGEAAYGWDNPDDGKSDK